jgi:hypothetical protein
MRCLSLPIGIFVIAFGPLAGAIAAQAAPETWVSGTGADSGACPITAPCRTFAYAHGQTTSGGAINVLTSGNFGPLTITKAISIVADGVEAVINTASVSAAIRIQAGNGQAVSLRGLTIEGVTGNNGISFVSGAALHVQNCSIRGGVDGIIFQPSAGVRELYVADSVIANASQNGIDVVPNGSGGAKVMLDRVRVENGTSVGIFFNGINTTGSINGTVRDSVASGNGYVGIRADETGSGTTSMTVDRSASLNNSIGINSNGPGARIRIGDSTVSGNSVGLDATFGGEILSYGTNKVDDGSIPTGTVTYR